MTKRAVKKKKKNPTDATISRATPAELWGENRWRIIKIVSSVIAFAIMFRTITIYGALAENDTLNRGHILPGFYIDVLLFSVGVFFLYSPFSPLVRFGEIKHRWLVGWPLFMGILSHFFANIVGMLMLAGYLI